LERELKAPEVTGAKEKRKPKVCRNRAATEHQKKKTEGKKRRLSGKAAKIMGGRREGLPRDG